MPKSKWIMGIIACLMLAGGIFCWLNTEEGPPPLPTASEAAASEAVFAVREAGAGTLPGSEAAAEAEPHSWIYATEPLLVNINTADSEELQRLPGIGPAKAEAILAYRAQHGDFERPEDLMKVPGIKAATFARLEPYVTV
jgi:competence protein ComEA